MHVKEGAYSLGTVPPGLDGKPPARQELLRPPITSHRMPGAALLGSCPSPPHNLPAEASCLFHLWVIRATRHIQDSTADNLSERCRVALYLLS